MLPQATRTPKLAFGPFEFDPEPMEGIKEYLDFVSEKWDQALSRLVSFVEI